MAGAVVAVAVVGAFMFFDSKDYSAGNTKHTNPYFIQIYSASYGINCNGSNEYAKPNEEGVREKVTVSVRRNNRLGRVSEFCNEEATCEFKVGKKTLGSVNTYACEPGLEVKYRCFRMDKLQTVRQIRGRKIGIDCRSAEVEKRVQVLNSPNTQQQGAQ